MEIIFTGWLSYLWAGQVVRREWTGQEQTWENGAVRLRVEPGNGPGSWVVEVKGSVELRELGMVEEVDVEMNDRFLANGFQSWSETWELGPEDRIAPLRSPLPQLMEQSGDYTFQRYAKQKGCFHSHARTYQRRGDHYTAWSGAQPEGGPAAYTIFEWRLPDQQLRIKWEVAGLQLDGEAARFGYRRREGTYSEAFPRPSALPAPVSGWTSWYNYYTDIDERIIRENVTAFRSRKLPIGIFQIDDGWQPAVGDWLEPNDKFPSGMADLAEKIHAGGFQAGLWWAPFIIDTRSTILTEHRDWLVTYDGEHLVRGGYNPGWGGVVRGSYYILDIYHPEVQSYLEQVMRRILFDWKFDLVKLDFLFAAGLVPRQGKSRAVIMADGMAMLRRWAGDKLILGCGVPLETAAEQVDFCRIGADVGLTWETKALDMAHLRERISTVSTLRATILRRLLSGDFFRNDPDVFILRPDNHELSPAQQNTLYLLNLALGDLVFTSDNVAEYSPAVLHRYRQQFPHRAKRVLSIQQFGEAYRIALAIGDRRYWIGANLGKAPVDLPVEPGVYFEAGKGLVELGTTVELPGHATRLWAVTAGQRVLGSDGHVFPGADVEAGTEAGMVRRAEMAVAEAEVWVRADSAGGQVRVNGQDWPVEVGAGGIGYVRVGFG